METNQLLQQLGISAGESIPVRVHYCLRGRHKGQWSITDYRPGHKRLVLCHVSEAVLTGNCRFLVSEASRQRVLGKQCRQVHAWVSGLWCPGQTAPPTANRISYNPYYSGTFHRYDGRTRGASVLSAPRVIFGRGGIAYI
jgi:hypothetical protein